IGYEMLAIINSQDLITGLHHGHKMKGLVDFPCRPAAAEILVAPDMVIERAGEGEALRQAVFDEGRIVDLIGAVIAFGQVYEFHLTLLNPPETFPMHPSDG